MKGAGTEAPLSIAGRIDGRIQRNTIDPRLRIRLGDACDRRGDIEISGLSACRQRDQFGRMEVARPVDVGRRGGNGWCAAIRARSVDRERRRGAVQHATAKKQRRQQQEYGPHPRNAPRRRSRPPGCFVSAERGRLHPRLQQHRSRAMIAPLATRIAASPRSQPYAPAYDRPFRDCLSRPIPPSLPGRRHIDRRI